MAVLDDKIKQLKDLIKIQEDTGNWDYDPYMFGLLNGMYLGLSVLDEKEPNFKSAPETWIADLEALEKFNNAGAVINELQKKN